MKKNINRILFKFCDKSAMRMYRRKNKHFLRLPANIRTKLLARLLRIWFGPSIKRSDEEIKQLQEEFLNYEYKGN